MGQFNICLPNNITGEVKWGKVLKTEKRFLDLFMPWKKFNTYERTGYIVKVTPAIENTTKFRFYKTKEGNWYKDAEATSQIEGDIAISIRKAIEQHEHL